MTERLCDTCGVMPLIDEAERMNSECSFCASLDSEVHIGESDFDEMLYIEHNVMEDY